MTSICCPAVRLPSLAVMVIVAFPADSPLIVTTSSGIKAVATAAFEVKARYDSGSPSGSVKYDDTSTVTVSPPSTS